MQPSQTTPISTLYTVETPEGIDIVLQPAGLAPRVWAFIIDFILRTLIIIIAAILLIPTGKLGTGLILILYFSITWLYMVLFEVFNNGRSPGKSMFGLQTLCDDGTPMRWMPSIVRNLLRTVDLLPFGYLFGILSCLFSTGFKRLGDHAAGTLVVYRSNVKKRPHYPDLKPLYPIRPLSTEEQQGILDLTERLLLVTPEKRREIELVLNQAYGITAPPDKWLLAAAQGIRERMAQQDAAVAENSPILENFVHRLTLLENFRKPRKKKDDDDEQETSVDPRWQEFPFDYRKFCNHLALTRTRGWDVRQIERLQGFALRAYQQVYRSHRSMLQSALHFLFFGFPRLIRKEWRCVALSALLFYGMGALLFFLVWKFPELIYQVMGADDVHNIENMYDPAKQLVGPYAERSSSDDWMMFGFYIQNNISIAFEAFSSGLLLGIGTIITLVLNGVYMGAISAHLTSIGYGDPFWSFVIGHGAFELNAIVLSGASGIRLGWAIIAPDRLTRRDALLQAGAQGAQIISGVFVMLLIAAFIEAYWSSINHSVNTPKYLAGALLWLLVSTYFLLAGRRGDIDGSE